MTTGFSPTRLIGQAQEFETSVRFRQIADVLQEALALINADFTEILYLNPAYEKIWGRSRESLYAAPMSWLDGVHAEDRQQVTDALQRLLRGEHVDNLEYRVVRPDGATSWVASRGYPVFDSNGSLHRLVCSAQDITRSKEAELALKRGEAYLAMGQRIAGIGTWVCNCSGGDMLGSQEFFRIFGIDPGSTKLTLDVLFQRVHPEDRSRYEQRVRAAAGQKCSWEIEYRIVLPNGSVKHIRCMGRPVINEAGDISELVATEMDITERRRAEEALKESEDRYRDLVENSQDLICTHNVEGIILSVNEAPLRILGYSREELLNKPLRDFVTPETKPLCDAYLAQVQRDGFAKGLLPVMTKSGEVRLWEYNNSVRREGVSQPIVRGIAHDVTEQKAAEKALRHLSRRLLQLQDEERRKIARDLHDTTGQDLVAMSATLGQLHASIPSSSRKSRKLVAQCQELTDRCIRDVRTLSYVLHPPMLEEAGLEDAIRHYVEGFAERTGIEVELQLSPRFGRVAREMELGLFRVVQESLINIQRHSGSFTASIRLDRDSGKVVLEVSDQGRGISANKRKSNGAIPVVAGVGIPSMDERVKQIGGRLDIESNCKGTTVRVTIPSHD